MEYSTLEVSSTNPVCLIFEDCSPNLMQGQFAMTHQAVLAAVTAQAQMQMQAAYPPPSETTTNSFPHSMLPAVSPVPLQQMSSVPEVNFTRKINMIDSLILPYI